MKLTENVAVKGGGVNGRAIYAARCFVGRVLFGKATSTKRNKQVDSCTVAAQPFGLYTSPRGVGIEAYRAIATSIRR